MSYLDRVLEMNPALAETAFELHRDGLVPPNTWVIDLDAIAENARLLASTARSLGLSTYLMSKQHNRNPYVNAIARAAGLGKVVAVDAQCALISRKYGIGIGHAGHLNQIPRSLVPAVVAMRPEVMTIYSLEAASTIAASAREQGMVQGILIRVCDPRDVCFEGIEGGFSEEEVPGVVERISAMPGLRFAGLTSFPCVAYGTEAGGPAELTPNMATLSRISKRLRALGIAVEQVNAPGNTSCRVMPLLAEAGATHVEPGNGLLGTTPDHALEAGLPEKTAVVFVSEVTHRYGGRGYALGGCDTFNDTYEATAYGLVGSDWETARYNRVPYLKDIWQCIDYHMVLDPGPDRRCEPGDTALFAFRTQMHMTRSYAAPVSGLSSGRPRLHYLFDNACNALDDDFLPASLAGVIADVEATAAAYR